MMKLQSSLSLSIIRHSHVSSGCPDRPYLFVRFCFCFFVKLFNVTTTWGCSNVRVCLFLYGGWERKAMVILIAFSEWYSSSSSSSSATSLGMSTGIFYSTIGGDTGRCARLIGDAVGGGAAAVEIEDTTLADVTQHDTLIVGSPTWNTGADTQRSMTAWDEWLYDELPKLDLKGKKLAVFGVGDQMGYTFNYCDAVGELYDAFTARGADATYGRTSTEGYAAVESKALAPPGAGEEGARWLGCLFDEVNQSDQSEDRAAKWVAQLREEGFFAN